MFHPHCSSIHSPHWSRFHSPYCNRLHYLHRKRILYLLCNRLHCLTLEQFSLSHTGLDLAGPCFFPVRLGPWARPGASVSSPKPRPGLKGRVEFGFCRALFFSSETWTLGETWCISLLPKAQAGIEGQGGVWILQGPVFILFSIQKKNKIKTANVYQRPSKKE